MDLDSAKLYLREVADRVESDGDDKLLLERDIPTMLGPGSLYFATKAFNEYVGNTKVALVSVYEPIKEQMDSAILHARNNGGRFAVFDSVEAAEAWLLKD